MISARKDPLPAAQFRELRLSLRRSGLALQFFILRTFLQTMVSLDTARPNRAAPPPSSSLSSQAILPGERQRRRQHHTKFHKGVLLLWQDGGPSQLILRSL